MSGGTRRTKIVQFSKKYSKLGDRHKKGNSWGDERGSFLGETIREREGGVGCKIKIKNFKFFFAFWERWRGVLARQKRSHWMLCVKHSGTCTQSMVTATTYLSLQ